MLSVGSRGDNVAQLQKALTAAGFDTGAADGVFGKKTKAAVEAYQKANHLKKDGIVGNDTGSKLLGASHKDVWESGKADAKPAVDGAFPANGTNAQKLQYAKDLAKKMGLTITSTTGGKHAAHSYHYKGRAIDVAGTPAQMAAYYKALKGTSPTELFYDPQGGIKNGKSIGAIGGHGDHVHIAY